MALGARRLIVVLTAMFMLVIAGCGNSSSGRHDAAGTEPPRTIPDTSLVYAILSEPTTLNPLYVTDTTASTATDLVYDGLVRLDDRLQWQPALASGWTADADGTLWIFTLRPDVKWHDGEPFTAADVEFTYRALKHERYEGPSRMQVTPIVDIEAIDDHHIAFRTDGPFAPFLSVASIKILPGHVYDWDPERVLTPNLDSTPIGTGPYTFAGREDGEIHLEANLDYWDGSPQIGRLIMRVVPGHPNILPAYTDAAVDVGGLTGSHVEAVRELGTFRIVEYPSHSYSSIVYDLKDPLFSDSRVRLALAHAIDREQMVTEALSGYGVVVDSHTVAQRWDYDAGLPHLQYDPQRAQQLLAAAGWMPDPLGRLVKDGRHFEFALNVHEESRTHWDTAELIQDYLSRIGITVHINRSDWSQYRSNLFDKGFQAALVAWRLGADPDDGYAVWHSEGAFNFGSFSNPEVDRLLDSGRRQLDLKDRRRTYVDLQRALAEEQPVTFLYSHTGLAAVHKRFTGPITGSPGGVLWNIHKWQVDADNEAGAAAGAGDGSQ